jgi:hypothetical protein
MINNHNTFAAVLAAFVGMDQQAALAQYAGNNAQAGLELATVYGYGYQDPSNPGNVDNGNYAMVVYYPHASGGLVDGPQVVVPYLLQFICSGPQGSLGPVNVVDLIQFGCPLPTLDQLVAQGQWPANAPA